MVETCEAQRCPSLPELLTEDMIMVKARVTDWKSAVEKAGGLLVKVGAVEPRYVEAMIKFKEEFGPYVVMAPGIAIPHARPEDGVNRPCLSLMTLQTPVEFGNEENDPVRLVLALGAVDARQHVTALAQLARLLCNEKAVEEITSTRKKEVILRIVSEYSEQTP